MLYCRCMSSATSKYSSVTCAEQHDFTSIVTERNKCGIGTHNCTMRQEDIEYKILGEIFVCPLAAVTYAESSGADPYEEVLLYIVHGLLHIMGYDDIGEKESQEMRSAEKRHIENLKRLNLSVKAPQHDVI